MQFIDEAKIFLKSGDGGNGASSFRREAHVARGGPDGGNGGRGGSVIFRSIAGLNTLIDFRYTQHFKANKGKNGQGRMCDGKSAEDMIIEVPVGTQIFDNDEELVICDFTDVGQEFKLADGGKGGAGNSNYKSSTNQAPRKANAGTSGEELWVWLKLKLLSDAGLIGLPNAGKSTFINRVTRTKAKIADYPFTTIKPQLGVVYIDEKEFVLADLPGLIAGASQGVGLGIRFLKHVERCGVLLHLIDATQENIVDNYLTIRKELSDYNSLLAEKSEIIALNKCDSLQDDIILQKKTELEKACGKKIHTISAVTGLHTKELIRELYKVIKRHGAK